MAEGMREVKISSALCEVVEQKFAARFGGLEQFLSFVLQALVREDAAQMDQDEQHIIEKRLKDLGYV